MLILYAAEDRPTSYMLSTFIFLLLVFLIIRVKIRVYFPSFNLGFINSSILSFILHSMIVLLFLVLIFTHWSLFNLDFRKVYAVRLSQALFFIPFFTIFFYFFILKSRNPSLNLLLSLCVLTLSALFVDALFLDVWAKALVIKPSFFTPAQLNFYYYDFFPIISGSIGPTVPGSESGESFSILMIYLFPI